MGLVIRWWGVKPWGKKSRIPGKNVKFKNHMRNIQEDVKKSICKSRLDILGENWAGQMHSEVTACTQY